LSETANLERKAASGQQFDRRSFAIISHPDAGKTTLTEKLLYRSGAIRAAGQVRAKGESRRTRSDWMEIEQQRGISVSSSVMTFEYGGLTFNLLDTPGHADFSEDTYRTLTAVDSAVMVIDAAKGIEVQTLKLFEVCRLRDIPIVTFVNKLDREGRDNFELLDEIEQRLALDVSPITWPVGVGQNFQGAYNFAEKTLSPNNGGELVRYEGLEDPALTEKLPSDLRERFEEETALVQEAYKPFDAQAFREGHMTPVLFGSALRECGVDQLLELLRAQAPAPRPQPAEPRTVRPEEKKFTGFVFKVQANLDPNHRDRVAFLRVCSGRFQRGQKLTLVRTGKPMAVSNPIFFFAQERELVEEAFPGDIIGIPNHGTLRVGDALTEGEAIRFTGIPNFAPEILRRIRLDDPMKAKQLKRALEDLAEEGVTQVFRPLIGADWIVGVVGALQLDVLLTRIRGEYKVEIGYEDAGYETARWLVSDDKAALKRFIEHNRGSLGTDRDDNPVLLLRNRWEMDRLERNAPEITFSTVRGRS
jgi:peptide chain release factor 3